MKNTADAANYDQLVAEKATKLIQLMELAAGGDSEIASLLATMRADLQRIADPKLPLPSDILVGWAYYFSWECPKRIDLNHPEIDKAEAELASLLRHSTMESFLSSKAFLESLSSRKPE